MGGWIPACVGMTVSLLSKSSALMSLVVGGSRRAGRMHNSKRIAPKGFLSLESSVKSFFLSLTSVLIVSSSLMACDKCGRSRHCASGAPMATMAVAPVSVAPVAVSSVPMAMMTAPVMMNAAPMTLASPYAVSSAVPMQGMYASSAPMYYTAQTASPYVMSSVYDQQFVVPQSYAQAYAGYDQQSLLPNLIGGLARPAACEVCRAIGCNSGNDSGRTDSVGELRDTIREIGELIKTFKTLEKDIKDTFGETTPEIERAPGEVDSQVAQLMEIRDSMRSLNNERTATRIVRDEP
jgi:hypothetical protein